MAADLLIVGAGVVGSAVARVAAADGRFGSVAMLRRRAVPTDSGEVLVGDARAVDLGLPPADAAELASELRSIVVAVGGVDFGASIGTAQAEHVAPVVGALEFARRCPKLERCVLVSSVVATGIHDGPVRSSWIPPRGYHRNFYEWAKQETERRARATGVPLTVVRPGHVLETDRDRSGVPHGGLFAALPVLAAGWPFPLEPAARYWCAPADLVGQTIVASLTAPAPPAATWCVHPQSPTFAQILDVLAFRHGIRVRRLPSRHLVRAATLLQPRWLGADFPAELLDYLGARFDLDLSCQTTLWGEAGIQPGGPSFFTDAVDLEVAQLRELA
jgi:nucleoside-diphosphate-sugar epimerase